MSKNNTRGQPAGKKWIIYFSNKKIIFLEHSFPEMEPGLRVTDQRVTGSMILARSGRVESRVSVSDPVIDPVLEFQHARLLWIAPFGKLISDISVSLFSCCVWRIRLLVCCFWSHLNSFSVNWKQFLLTYMLWRNKPSSMSSLKA